MAEYLIEVARQSVVVNRILQTFAPPQIFTFCGGV